jgi:hypothetical protein
MTCTRSSRTLHRNHRPALLAATLSLAAACSTQEVPPPPVFEFAASATESANAPLILVVAPDADTISELQSYHASGTEYALHIDGQPVGRRDGSTWIPIDHIRAQQGPGGFVPAGPHVVQLVDQNGNTALDTPPLDLQPNHANILMVFGHRAALEHRFLATDLAVPSGMDRLVVINLIRSGYAAQIVRCDDEVLLTCPAVLSGPLAYRETAQVDFPAPAAVPCTEAFGPTTCTVGPYAGVNVLPSGGAVPSNEAPFWSSGAGTHLGHFLNHPDAAHVRFGAPVIVDSTSGISVGF